MKLCDLCSRDEETNEFKEEDERLGEQEEKIETDIWTTNDLHMKPVVQLLDTLLPPALFGTWGFLSRSP